MTLIMFLNPGGALLRKAHNEPKAFKFFIKAIANRGLTYSSLPYTDF